MNITTKKYRETVEKLAEAPISSKQEKAWFGIFLDMAGPKTKEEENGKGEG